MLRKSIGCAQIAGNKIFTQHLRCLAGRIDFNNDQKYSFSKTWRKNVFNATIAAGVAGWIIYHFKEKRTVFLKAVQEKFVKPTEPDDDVGIFIDNLPVYTLNDVSEHNSIINKVWVTYKQGVYDVTDFVEQHPGGDLILLAAGNSVEPFWMLYAVHKNPHVFKILETMRIGNISAEDASEAVKGMSDPYSLDPPRHKLLKPATVKPFNAEPPVSLLVENFVTPNEFFYVRNHLPVPLVNPETYELEVEVDGTDKSITLTLDDIKKLPQHSVAVTIMCAGNRRSEMMEVKPVKGLSWGPAAVSNAVWTGARLKDVLKLVGIDENSKDYYHVQFEGLDTDPTNTPYGASIPIWKALSEQGDVILAYEMNGEDIPRDHGFPIRAVVPGVVGARNVKWLGRIIVSKEESESHWQQNDYKGFCPSTDWDTVDFKKAPAIQELPVISAICKPYIKETVHVKDGFINVYGYAWSGGGQKIIRVDVSVDEGETWVVAKLEQDQTTPPRHWAWTLWKAKVPVKEGLKNVEIWAKAIDSSYNTQPESFKNIWNLRGVLNNAYHRIPINLKW